MNSLSSWSLDVSFPKEEVYNNRCPGILSRSQAPHAITLAAGIFMFVCTKDYFPHCETHGEIHSPPLVLLPGSPLLLPGRIMKPKHPSE